MLAMVLVCHPLAAQGQDHALAEVLSRYATRMAGQGNEDLPVPELKDNLDEIGRAWTEWVLGELNRLRQPADLPIALSACVRNGDPGGTIRMHLESRRQDWVLLSLEVPVPCGSHSMLALLRKTSDGWKLAMQDVRDRLVPTNELGARENLQVLLLAGPRVVIAATPPWCTSCWSRIDVRVIRPGNSVDHPHVQKSHSIPAYRCQDYVFKLEQSSTEHIRVRYFNWAGPENVLKPAVQSLAIR